MAGQDYYLGLGLLDRQLVDRRGRLVGKVDDLELELGGDGAVLVIAILSGPGTLAQRMGFRRYGAWVQRAHRLLLGSDADPAWIPFTKVSKIGNHVDLAADQEELATQSSHRWVVDHVIGRIPGGRRAPE
jgi:sporulation protein YlmC with PRC-barrel domain